MERPTVFKNRNGKQLIGILHLPNNNRGKFPLVIFCHGFGGTKTKMKYVRLARALEKKGIASLRFDFEGCGDSEGDFEKITAEREVLDLTSAVNCILRQKNINKNKIAFLGNSFGALVCLIYITRNNFPAKAIVFLTPALNQKELFSIWYTKSDLRKWQKRGYIIHKEDKIGMAYLKENEKKDYSKLFSKIRTPILIIHGKKDETVPLKLSKELAKKYKNIKLISFPKADHKFEDYYIQERLVRKTVNWFKEKLFS